VFLSPRVIDSSTLGEFAASLRVILDQAQKQREHLCQTVLESERVVETLRDTAAQASEKLRPAVKLLPAIEAKLAQARQAMDTATKAAATTAATTAASTPRNEHSPTALSSADAGNLSHTTTTPRPMETTLEATLRANCAKEIADLQQATLHANNTSAAAIEKIQDALGHATRGAHELEARLSKLTDHAESALDTLKTHCKNQLDQAAQHAQDVLGTTIAEIDTRSDRALKDLTAQIDKRTSDARAALESALPLDEPTPTRTHKNTPTTRAANSADAHTPTPETPSHDQPEITDQTDQTDTIDYTKHTIDAQLIAHQLNETVTQAREMASRAETNLQALFDTMTSRLDTHASTLRAKLDTQIQEAASRVVEAERAADAAQERADAARHDLTEIHAQLETIQSRGRAIVASAGHALGAFDQELASRMQTLRQMVEQLACVTAPPPPPQTPPRTSPATPQPASTEATGQA